MILVAGSANLDFVVRTARIPMPGETVLGRDMWTFPGGKGANQAIACARAGGCSTAMLLALGDDAFAAPIEALPREAAVLTHVVRPARPSGTAFICVSDDADNAIVVAPGAMRRSRRRIYRRSMGSLTCCCSSKHRSTQSRPMHAQRVRAASLSFSMRLRHAGCGLSCSVSLMC